MLSIASMILHRLVTQAALSQDRPKADSIQRNDVERLDRHTVQTNIAIDDEVLVSTIFHCDGNIFNVSADTQRQVPTYIHNSGFANTNDLSIDNSISTEAAVSAIH